jgi:protease IV
MTPEQVEKVARGRVWTGEQALALGLVDQLGGLHMALELAKKEVCLPLDASVDIFPEPKTLWESLSSLFGKEEEDDFTTTGIMGTILNPIRKIMAVFTLLFSSQEALYAPIGEVK